MVISNRSFDIDRSASRIWKGEGGQGRHHHDEEDAELDAVKPDDGDDHPGERRDALEEHQHRRDVTFHARGAADRKRHDGAQDEGTKQPGEDPHGRDQHLCKQWPTEHDRHRARDDVGHRREEIRRKEQRDDLPDAGDDQRARGRLQEADEARISRHGIGFP
jgi:hypothetical protein